MTDSELVKPELIEQVAHRVLNGKAIVTEVYTSGFVLQHSRNRSRCTFVGLREAGQTYVVAKMWHKSETIGRGDPKIQTSKNEYVQCELYRMDVVEPTDSDETVEAIADTIDNERYAEKIDTGYLHGYRLTPLSDVLDDVFRWYNND